MTSLGHYRNLTLLGQGGMGEVYLAEDSKLGRKVALKVLRAAFVEDQGRLRRFIQEAKTASALNHPNIVTVYEIGEIEGAHFLAMEYIEGKTLRQRLAAAGGRLPALEAAEIGHQAAGALAAAHAAGIVHRDIKPENIMIRRDGYLKILDFGLAKLVEQEAPSGDAATAPLGAVHTTAGLVLGTAQYMSPEQARGLAVDARSDLFSLGIVLYEMLAGRPPFEGDTTSHRMVAILEKTPAALKSQLPDLPDELDRIVEKALTKDVEERYQRARDLGADLKRLRRRLDFDTEAVPGITAKQAPPSRRRPWLFAALGMALVLAAFVGYRWWKPAPAAPVETREELTAGEIVRLLEAGISEPVLTARVRTHGRAIPPTAEEVLRLKKAGASDNLLLAMLDPSAKPAPAATPAPAPTPRKAPDLPAAAGMYVWDGGKWTAMPAAAPREEIQKSKRFLGVRTKRERVSVALPGLGAKLRLASSRPRFLAQSAVQLVRLTANRDTESRQTPDLVRARIACDVTSAGPPHAFFIAPLQPLAPGQYALVDPAARYFDFAVTPK